MQANLPANPFERRMQEIDNCLTFNLANAKKQCVFPTGIEPERLGRIALKTIRLAPELANCTPQSLVSCIIEAAGLGLEIDKRGLAYFVPFGQKAQLVIGYKGFIELAYRSGKVSAIYAEVVCRNDQFEYEMGLNPKLKHIPALGDRGDMVAVYAVARMKDSEPLFVVLSNSDVQEVRGASKTSKIWSQWPKEMAKKTAIRKLAKMLPLSPNVQMAVVLDEQTEYEEAPKGQYEVVVEDKSTVSQRMGLKPKAIEEEQVMEQEEEQEEVENPAKHESITRLFAEFCDKMNVDAIEAFKVAALIAKQKKISKDDAKVYAINNPAEFAKLLPVITGQGK